MLPVPPPRLPFVTCMQGQMAFSQAMPDLQHKAPVAQLRQSNTSTADIKPLISGGRRQLWAWGNSNPGHQAHGNTGAGQPAPTLHGRIPAPSLTHLLADSSVVPSILALIFFLCFLIFDFIASRKKLGILSSFSSSLVKKQPAG